jgi:hypothetical protein
MSGLEQMLAELESNRLEVQLVPLNPRLRNYNAGGMKRVAASRNAKWYSDFCRRHLSSRKRNRRKWDTKIKRQGVIEILSRMCVGKTTTSKYAAEFRAIAQKIAA